MIKVKNPTTNTEIVVTPTKFPDGTQQVWKLPKELLDDGPIAITWHYESDAEFIPLIQLAQLCVTDRRHSGIDLVMPFLPYGRQDKDVSNDTTFGLFTFMALLQAFPFKSIKTFDIHNYKWAEYPRSSITSLRVDKQVEQALENSECDLVCFPDAGASKRGYKIEKEVVTTSLYDSVITKIETIPSFNLDKKRNQSTGVIEGLVCSLPLDLKGKTILIVDDICDGGKTFIEAAKLLYGMGAEHVDLYVTHGIFSNGIHVLTELGKIRNIYTTDSILKNVERSEKHTNLTVFKLEL